MTYTVKFEIKPSDIYNQPEEAYYNIVSKLNSSQGMFEYGGKFYQVIDFRPVTQGDKFIAGTPFSSSVVMDAITPFGLPKQPRFIIRELEPTDVYWE